MLRPLRLSNITNFFINCLKSEIIRLCHKIKRGTDKCRFDPANDFQKENSRWFSWIFFSNYKDLWIIFLRNFICVWTINSQHNDLKLFRANKNTAALHFNLTTLLICGERKMTTKFAINIFVIKVIKGYYAIYEADKGFSSKIWSFWITNLLTTKQFQWPAKRQPNFA